MFNIPFRLLAAFALTSMLAVTSVYASDIKLLYPITMVSAIKQLLPEFEQSSSDRVTAASGNIGTLTDRVKRGEAADVLIVSPDQIDALIAANRVVSGTQVIIAKTPIVVIVRKGAPKPDISSLEAFKQTLLAAKSITFNDPLTGGPVGVYATTLLEHLGMTDKLKPKIKLARNGVSAVNENISTGVAEIGITQTSELINMPDVEVVGSLPAPIAHATVFAGGIVTAGAEKAAGKSLIDFLASSAAKPAFVAIGLE